jgi:magnesium transporter
MIRSFVFSQGKLLGQDLTLDFLKVVLHDEGVHMWVDVSESTDEETKGLLEGVFGFHPLAIEDCLTPSDLPKIDEYDNYVFMVIHAVDYSHDVHEFQTNEVNMFIGKNFLVTVHRDPLRCVASTIDRVLKNAAAVARAPDRLTYTILDFLLDSYGPATDELATEISDLEKSLLTARPRDALNEILKLKSEVQRLRQIVSPQRDVLTRLARGEFKIVRAHMLPYYRDLLDHLVRISDRGDGYRDALTNTLSIHLNLQQVQINEVIRVLTIAATLAMPIVIVTSYYGMNFRNFSELDVPHPHLWVWAWTAIGTLSVYLAFLRPKRH